MTAEVWSFLLTESLFIRPGDVRDSVFDELTPHSCLHTPAVRFSSYQSLLLFIPLKLQWFSCCSTNTLTTISCLSLRSYVPHTFTSFRSLFSILCWLSDVKTPPPLRLQCLALSYFLYGISHHPTQHTCICCTGYCVALITCPSGTRHPFSKLWRVLSATDHG